MSVLQYNQNPFLGLHINTKQDAIINLHRASELQKEIDRIKGECGDYLSTHYAGEKRVSTRDGLYSVILVTNQRKEYKHTLLYKIATKIMQLVERITPTTMKPVGKGYYYKASK